MSGFVHVLPVRVYYEDTDHGGVVYYANWLKFMERGRTEFLREQGLELDDLAKRHGVMFAVTEAHVRYHRSARFNDLLEVESRLVRLRGARIAFDQRIRRADERLPLCSARIDLACIDAHGRPRRIPAEIISRLRPTLSKGEPRT
ncbi:MAG: tol-pal system-associated acyl-CoA thioesterase [Mariprofundaceae bacterium]